MLKHHMTKIDGVPDAAQVIPGMAYFAGTGPQANTCGECASLGYSRQSKKATWREDLQEFVYRHYRVRKCRTFNSMTGRHGPNVKPATPCCKYFETKPTKGR